MTIIKNHFFLFCTYNTVSITLKRVSKRSSFRYAFQEHLLKFLMLAVTHNELLLPLHFTIPTLNSKLTIIVRLFILSAFIFVRNFGLSHK
jgi:hypothetical protein